MASDDDIFGSALNRASDVVAEEHARARQETADLQSTAAFEATQHERMRTFLVGYFDRLRAAQQPHVDFRTTRVRRVKNDNRVDIQPGRNTAYVVAFHAYSGSDYATHANFMRRLLLTGDGRLWTSGLMATGGFFSRTVTVGQSISPVGNEPYYNHLRDFAGFVDLFALDFRRRMGDPRYAAALMDPTTDDKIRWIWEHSPSPSH